LVRLRATRWCCPATAASERSGATRRCAADSTTTTRSPPPFPLLSTRTSLGSARLAASVVTSPVVGSKARRAPL
jgi:hypothetical protein